MRPLLVLGALVGLALCVPYVGGAAAQDTEEALVATAAPGRDVYAGVFLHDIADVQIEDGVFQVDFVLWAKWRGAFDPDQLMIANAAEVERIPLGHAADGDWHVARWRVRGSLRSEFPMQAFPYDQQSVAVVLELPQEHGHLVIDAAGSGMSERFTLTDWAYEPEFHLGIAEETVASDLGFLSREGLPTTVRRATYEVYLIRPLVTVALKIFLPLAIIALVALIALFLPAEAIEPRAGVGVTALLSCFAFQFTLDGSLPAVSYLTLTDILFLIAYVLSTAALVVSIVSHTLDRRGHSRGAIWTDRVCRGLLPLASAVAVGFAIPAVPQRAMAAADPAPGVTIPASARDRLRIGSNHASNLLSGVIYRGVYWDIARDVDGDGRSDPTRVTRQPGIDNDRLRFAADGTLEVRWQLREDTRWSDGERLTSLDVAFAQQLWEDEHVLRVETPDPETAVFVWDGRLADALLSPPAAAHHHLEDLYDVEGRDAVLDRMRHSVTPTLGPYRVSEAALEERFVVEANPHFEGPPPAIAHVEEIRYEPADLVRAFLAGEVDVTLPQRHLHGAGVGRPGGSAGGGPHSAVGGLRVPGARPGGRALRSPAGAAGPVERHRSRGARSERLRRGGPRRAHPHPRTWTRRAWCGPPSTSRLRGKPSGTKGWPRSPSSRVSRRWMPS